MPLLSKKFWNKNNSEIQNGSPTVTFGDMRQEKFTKLWYPYYLNTFDTKTFLKHRRVRPRCFSAVCDKKTSTEKLDTPFLSLNYFGTRTFLKDKSVPPRSFSVLWWLKVFHGKTWNTPILHKVFLGALNFLNHWRVLHKFIGTLRQKQLTEPWCPYYPKNFETRIILKHRRVLPRWFLAMWDKKNRKIVIPLLSKDFWYQNISETQEGAPTMFFGSLWQKNFDGKLDTPFLSLNYFGTRTFLKDKSVPPRSFSVLWWLKVFHGKTWNTPILHKVFLGALNFLNHWRVLHKFIGTLRQKQLTEPWCPYYPKNFETRIILKHRTVRQRWFLAIWDKKNWQNCDTLII